MAKLITLLSSLAVLIGLYFLKRFLGPKRKGSLPPGPKGLPFVGNVFDMPNGHNWKTFARWGTMYGEPNFLSV